MSYIPKRSGFTGPSSRIGGSSGYHIDLKMLDTLPLAEKVKAVDSLSRQYKSIGREIEFSNQAVSGQRYNADLPFDERARLLMQAAKAHAPRQGWHSLDFYVPFKGKSRFDKGAVEGASIYLPAIPGGKVRRGSGGNYGFYSEALDPSGRTVFKVGHGDISRPEKEGEINVLGNPPSAPQLPPAQAQNINDARVLNLFESLFGAQEKKQESLTDTLMGGLLQQALSRRGNLAPTLDALSGQPNPYSQYILIPKMLEQFE